MISTLPDLSIFATIALLAYWGLIVVAVLGGLACAALAYTRSARSLVYVSAGLLALALVLAGVPLPTPPVVVTIVLALATLALATIGGGPLVQLVLALAGRGTLASGSFGGIVVAARDRNDQPGATREVLRGGTTIGLLERFATAGTILAGFPAAIAVLVAIKSVGRYSELDEPEARERFIIGTLVSLIWACACAGVFQLVVR